MSEVEFMKKLGYHENVVSIIACITLEKPYCLVVEFMDEGDLMHYLRKNKFQVTRLTARGEGTRYNLRLHSFSHSCSTFLTVCRQR